jgi:RNA polymerase sigma-70 factor, ECF subfamily
MTARASPADDSDLRACVAAGDRGAIERVLLAELAFVYEFVHHRVGGDRARAEDVVQDTYLVALRKADEYDGRSSLGTWLCGIARNKIRADRRKRAPMALEDALAGSEGDIDAILADVSREELPDEVIARRETKDLVGATLSSLPPDYKSALVSKYVDGLSVAVIAERAGKGEKAAESTLTRARVAFARVFELLAKRRGGLE